MPSSSKEDDCTRLVRELRNENDLLAELLEKCIDNEDNLAELLGKCNEYVNKIERAHRKIKGEWVEKNEKLTKENERLQSMLQAETAKRMDANVKIGIETTNTMDAQQTVKQLSRRIEELREIYKKQEAKNQALQKANEQIRESRDLYRDSKEVLGAIEETKTGEILPDERIARLEKDLSDSKAITKLRDQAEQDQEKIRQLQDEIDEGLTNQQRDDDKEIMNLRGQLKEAEELLDKALILSRKQLDERDEKDKVITGLEDALRKCQDKLKECLREDSSEGGFFSGFFGGGSSEKPIVIDDDDDFAGDNPAIEGSLREMATDKGNVQVGTILTDKNKKTFKEGTELRENSYETKNLLEPEKDPYYLPKRNIQNYYISSKKEVEAYKRKMPERAEYIKEIERKMGQSSSTQESAGAGSGGESVASRTRSGATAPRGVLRGRSGRNPCASGTAHPRAARVVEGLALQ